MNADLAPEIELYLLAAKGWVTTEELCVLFEVKERAFRSIEKRPGLCSEFAISGDRGFKHVELATTAEWLQFKGRMVWHAIGELRRVRKLQRKRRDVLSRRTTAPTERDTGQQIFPTMTAEGPHGAN